MKQKQYRQELAELIRSIVLERKGERPPGGYIIGTGLAIVDFNNIETTPFLPGYSSLTQAFFVIYHEWLHHAKPELSEAAIDAIQQPQHLHAVLLQALKEFEKNSGIASLSPGEESLRYPQLPVN